MTEPSDLGEASNSCLSPIDAASVSSSSSSSSASSSVMEKNDGKENYEIDEEEDEDDEDDEDDEEEDDALQLGFVVPLDSLEEDELPMFDDNKNWNGWDGGRIGGRPFWLHPTALPHPSLLECPHCREPLSFLLQIYCPLDDHAPAFHRMLYLFCCRRGSCSRQGGSFIALRCQLPRSNLFYAAEAKSQDASSPAAIDDETSVPTKQRLCAVCGCNGPLQCNVSGVTYCSKSHQKLHWLAGHKQVCKALQEQKKSEGGPSGALGVQTALSPSKRREQHAFACVFPQYDIEVCNALDMAQDAAVTDSESPSLAVCSSAASLADSTRRAEAMLEEAKAAAAGGGAAAAGGGGGTAAAAAAAAEQREMDEWTPKDLREMMRRPGCEDASTDDAVTRRFLVAVHSTPGCGDQILRYCRWPASDGAVQVAKRSAVDGEGRAAASEGSDEERKTRPTSSSGPLWVKAAEQIAEDSYDAVTGGSVAASSSSCSSSSSGSSSRSDKDWSRKRRVVPPCARCGAARRFEFQVMPQLLHYLNPASSASTVTSAASEDSDEAAVEKTRVHLAEDSLDWGTLAVFTCTASCQDRDAYTTEDEGDTSNGAKMQRCAYVKEFVWRQGPL